MRSLRQCWGEALTATQIANDYATKLTLAGQATSIPPLFWTKDGDDILDNANDSTHDNWGVALCIPGSAPALTKYELSGQLEGDTYTIGNWELSEFISPERVLYYEQSGTADASCSGGQFLRTSISTTEALSSLDTAKWEFSQDPSLLRFVRGRRFSCVVRLRNAGLGYLRWRHVLSNQYKQQPQRIAAAGGFFRNYLLPALTIPETNEGAYLVGDLIDTIVVNSAAANVDVDYLCLFPHPLFTAFFGSAIVDGREIDGRYGVSATTVTGVITGGEINLRPYLYNVLMMSQLGSSAGLDENSIGSTLTFSSIEVTPRWELLQ
jgi:hypothetical protein